MRLLNSEDLFIFNLLTAEESAQLIDYLKLYAELCAERHDPEFIGMIENERVRSAFAYFNNRFARRRPRKKPVEQETRPEEEKEMVKLPSNEAAQQLTEAIADSSTSTRDAINQHCPRVASRYKLKNKDYNLMRLHPAETAAIFLEMEQMSGVPSGNYLIRRLRTHTELDGLSSAGTYTQA